MACSNNWLVLAPGSIWPMARSPRNEARPRVLMAQVEGRPEDVIAQLADLCPGPVYYQLNAPTLAEREREAPQFTARPKPS
ncbi:MAG: hypothetical protein RLZZ226_785 [Pseudomonadota bacterium]